MLELNAFGQVDFSQRIVIDLEPETPTVVSCQLSQKIG